MRHKLINKHIKFWYSNGLRHWFMNGQFHRSDGGPAYEDVKTGYCAFCEYGSFIRNNQ